MRIKDSIVGQLMIASYLWRRFKKFITLLRTPSGRSQLLVRLRKRKWPMLRRAATLHRMTVARRTRVVAVVGSFGKSTTMRAVTTDLGRKVHPRAVLNFNSSLARAILRIRPWQRYAVVEVGIGSRGQMAAFARLVRPDITVVTSIGSEHNSSLKNAGGNPLGKGGHGPDPRALGSRRPERRRPKCPVDAK
jgi:UDP-N-acetylmuramoylalanine-D-glutamate ligase